MTTSEAMPLSWPVVGARQNEPPAITPAVPVEVADYQVPSPFTANIDKLTFKLARRS